ncbi:MAG: class A beta-lactamase-related serine hydrolase, partial [Ignavibacteriales bacterium]
MKIFYLSIILTALLSLDCSGQNEFNFDKVEIVVNDAIKDSAFPGAVVLISKDGTIYFHKAFGHYTYDSDSKETNINSIYDLASLTKVIATTTAAMICIDRHLFNLEDKVSDFIPEFTPNNKENIAVKNLLLHNSGLPAWKKFWGVYDRPEEILSDIYTSELEYSTGTKTFYSDLGIITLAKIIEKVSGKSFSDFCKEGIFIPLEMSDTYFNPSDSLKYRTAPTEQDNYWRKRLLIGEVHDETASLLNGVA